MFSFGKTSNIRKATLELGLQLILDEAISVSSIDFGIAEGHRPVDRQFELFQLGRILQDDEWVVVDSSEVRTNVDGVNVLGEHNHFPSRAFDIYAWVNGRVSWEREHLVYLAGVIMATAQRLYNEGIIDFTLVWGGNWDGDGQIISDQTFIDLPHFQKSIK